MPPLSEMQSKFAAALMQADAPVPAGITSHTGDRPKKRFNVYRNNIYASLILVLEGRFPVVSRLVGAEFFTALARVFVELHPPRSPVLMEYGEGFGTFLQEFDPVDDLPYLGDVARIEWAWNVAYYSADAAPLGPDALTQVAPDDVPRLILQCHPSLSTVSSQYPAVTIWKTNTDDEVVKPVDLAQGSEDAMIIRPETDVTVRHLPIGAAKFISDLQSGLMLGAAFDLAAAKTPEFDLQQNLGSLIRSGAFTGFSISNGVG